MKSMFVKPAKGLQVRDPIKGTHLPVEGAKVPRSSYWLRRLEDGDVEVTSAKATKKPGGDK